jgi:hypothetical protein
VPDLTLEQTCAGEVVVFTGGQPDGYSSRDEAAKEVLKRGGRVVSSVSKKTTVVFAGDNAGTKYDRARQLSKPVYPHAMFADFLREGHRAAQSTGQATIQLHNGQTEIIEPGKQVGAAAKPLRPGTHNEQTSVPTPADNNVETPVQPTADECVVSNANDTTIKSPAHEQLQSEIRGEESIPAPATSLPRIDGRRIAPERRQESSVAGLATLSVALGSLWIFWVGSFAAVILGHICLHRLSKAASQRGRRRAILGLVLGYLGVAFLALGIWGVMLEPRPNR